MGPLYPIEATQKMLECFDGEHILQEQQPTNTWLSRIADIGQELWIYSKNRELLTDEEDQQYLLDNLNTIKIQIDVIIEEIKSSIKNEVLLSITELCANVYAGVTFDDKEYNEMISCIQSASI